MTKTMKKDDVTNYVLAKLHICEKEVPLSIAKDIREKNHLFSVKLKSKLAGHGPHTYRVLKQS